jgi:hypothetical protein
VSALDAAAALLRTAPRGATAADAVDLTALAGAESGWDLTLDSRTDRLAGSPYTCPPDSPTPAPFSFGAWQINVLPSANADKVPGSTACEKRAWLYASWDHAAQAAWRVWASQGPGAWSTWWAEAARRVGPGLGPYRAYLPAARDAVAAAAAGGPAGTAAVLPAPVLTVAPTVAPRATAAALPTAVLLALGILLAVAVL